MTEIGPRRRKFTEFMANHIFGDQYRDVFLPIVNAEGETDKLR